MYSLQRQIPRLPVPPLLPALELYMQTLLPLQSEAEFRHTKSLVQDFAASTGPALHAKLEAFAEKHPNWLEVFWEAGYLADRTPVAINVNYYLQLARPKQHLSQLQHAAMLVHAAAEWGSKVEKQELEPDMAGKQPLCMSQFPRVLWHARVPKRGQDEIHQYGPQPEELPTRHPETVYHEERPRHIAVLIGQQVYRVPVLDERRAALPAAQILASLEAVSVAAKDAPRQAATVGAFTAADRDTAADTRDAVLAAGNAEQLAAVDSAMFVLCLDGPDARAADGRKLASGEAVDEHTNTHRVMVGDPGVGNRWFDKHNLIVRPDGSSGWCLEHSQGDATPVLKLLDFMVAQRDAADVPSPSGKPVFQPVQFNLDDTAVAKLADAEAQWKEAERRVNTNACLFDEFGASGIKAAGCAPDAFVQMGFQVAQQRMYGVPAPAYESCATRGFLHGRTETGRSTSMESMLLAAAMAPHASVDKRAVCDVRVRPYVCLFAPSTPCSSPRSPPLLRCTPSSSACKKRWQLSARTCSALRTGRA